MTFHSNLEAHLLTLLDSYSVEEIFELYNLTPLEALMVLFRAGHLDFSDVYDYNEDLEDELS